MADCADRALDELGLAAGAVRGDDEGIIVVDVQAEYLTGRLPIAYPPIADSLANIGRAIDAANAAGIAVVVIQQDGPADAPVFATGSETWQLLPEVASRPSDVTFHKHLPGAFTGTGLEEWLSSRGIDTVSIAGYMTNVCVDTTARQAAHLGLSVEVLGDATGALAYRNVAGAVSAEEMHHAVLATMHAAMGAVVTTDGWIAALDGPALPRGDLLASTDSAAASVM